MPALSKIFRSLSAACGVGLVLLGTAGAQEPMQTPSQKTREAIQKFSQTPKAIGKRLDALGDAARAKLQEALGEKRPAKSKAASDELSVPAKPFERAGSSGVSLDGKRDPFRPLTLRSKTAAQPRENLSPLERYELGQLRVTGIVWDVKEPTAMVEDTGGLGYIIKVGTPIGANEGKVKAIRRNEIVVEEVYSDIYGAKRKRDVSIKLSND